MINLPKTWQNDRLKDIAQINSRALSANTDPDYEFDYLEISNVDYHGIIDPQAIERLRYEDAPSRARRRVFTGSTVISSVRPNLQAVAFIENGRADLVCSTGFNVVEPFEWKLQPKFAYYVLISEASRQYFEAAAKGVGYPAVDDKDFSSLGIPLPPLSEQKRIATYLDASCAAIDAAVAAKQRQIDVLKTMLASIIAQSVVRGLDQSAVRWDTTWPWFQEVPKHWRYGHLKRFATRIQTGVTPPTANPEYYEGGTIPWFAPGSYDGDLELNSPRKLINETALHDGALRMFPAGTIFFIGIGATIGKVGIVTVPASCNQQIIGIVTRHDLLPRYLAYQMKIYEAIIPEIATATTLPIFDQVKTGYLPVMVPPKQEQQSICEYLDAKRIESKQTITMIEQQITTLTAYRKSLIHECVTGLRRVTDEDVKRAEAQWPGARNLRN